MVKNITFLVIFQVLFLFNLIKVQAVTWQSGNWAFACDFKGNDLTNTRVPADQCGPRCVSTNGCSHFTWTTYNGGTCWMKQGAVSKSNAFDTNDRTMVCGVVSSPAPPTPVGQLVWSDEFNGYGFPDNWTPSLGENGPDNGGWRFGTGELPYYTNALSNVCMKDQFLTITALKEKKGVSEYTSGRLNSKKSFTYGVFEMRAKIPRGLGTWPAFWLLSRRLPANWPLNGEIDIMEAAGNRPNKIYGTAHNQRVSPAGQGSTVMVDNPYDNFHTYKIDWNSKRIRWYVDNKEYFVYRNDNRNDVNTWPYNHDYYIIINLALGGVFENQQSNIDQNALPAKYIIDYVRVYAPNNND